MLKDIPLNQMYVTTVRKECPLCQSRVQASVGPVMNNTHLTYDCGNKVEIFVHLNVTYLNFIPLTNCLRAIIEKKYGVPSK